MENTLNEPQQERFSLRLKEYSDTTDVTPGMKALIWTLACVEIEEETLQRFINENGTCYVVMGTSGDMLSKMRPEWSQLKEARMRKQTLIQRIELNGRGVEAEEEGVEEFFR